MACAADFTAIAMVSRDVAELFGQSVVRIFGPGQPDAVDLLLVGRTELGAQFGKSREMVLVLVSSDYEMEMSVGGLVDIGDHVGKRDLGRTSRPACRSRSGCVFVAAWIEGQQETVAQALAVHAHAHLRHAPARQEIEPELWLGAVAARGRFLLARRRQSAVLDETG